MVRLNAIYQGKRAALVIDMGQDVHYSARGISISFVCVHIEKLFFKIQLELKKSLGWEVKCLQETETRAIPDDTELQWPGWLRTFIKLIFSGTELYFSANSCKVVGEKKKKFTKRQDDLASPRCTAFSICVEFILCSVPRLKSAAVFRWIAGASFNTYSFLTSSR